MQMLIKVSNREATEKETILNERSEQMYAFKKVTLKSPSEKRLFCEFIFYVFLKDY